MALEGKRILGVVVEEEVMEICADMRTRDFELWSYLFFEIFFLFRIALSFQKSFTALSKMELFLRMLLHLQIFRPFTYCLNVSLFLKQYTKKANCNW